MKVWAFSVVRKLSRQDSLDVLGVAGDKISPSTRRVRFNAVWTLRCSKLLEAFVEVREDSMLSRSLGGPNKQPPPFV